MTKACKDNLKNKVMMTDNLNSVILNHLPKPKEGAEAVNLGGDGEDPVSEADDVNAYMLLREVVIDNKNIILNEKTVKHIAEKICDTLFEIDGNDVRKAYYLSILSPLMKLYGYTMKNNQNVILTQVISKKYGTNIMIQFESKDFFNEIENIASIKILEESFIKKNYLKIFKIPSKLCYIIAYLDLLTSCTEDKNAFSENICQNLVNLENLKKLLDRKEFNIIIKYSLTMFFYHVYLDTEREIPFHILEMFITILKSMERDYEFYAMKKYKDHDDDYVIKEENYILAPDSYITYLEWIEKYLLILIDSFVNIIRRNINLIPDSEPYREYNKF